MAVSATENMLPDSVTIREAMQRLEQVKTKIVILTGPDGSITGTLTDGDFRRALLNNDDTKRAALDIANHDPYVVSDKKNPGELRGLLREKNVRFIPLVDDAGRATGLFVDDTSFTFQTSDIPVVLMAGGLGRRLMPLTENCPKPMLPLGDKPMLQHIIDRFVDQGFRKFYLSINYLGHMVEDYFGSGRDQGLEISYLRENKRLGTGGALSLLPNNMQFPVIVMNGDLLVEVDFNALVQQHVSEDAKATMCVREYMTSIPFGVVDYDGTKYIGCQEKPTLKHYINAGMYCLSRDAVSIIPDDEFYDMPTLFSDLTEDDKDCGVHVLRGGWIDIGSRGEYEAAQRKFEKKL